MKGIIMAAGTGSRLWPLTLTISKHLLPVYEKPLIYYPLSTLMLSGIRDILIICNSRDKLDFVELFGNGTRLGLNIQYALQDEPNGIAEAFVIGKKFIGNDEVSLILGDNIFYGSSLGMQLQNNRNIDGASIYLSEVSNPRDYGIAIFNKKNLLIGLDEKPIEPKSHLAITGLYYFENSVVEIAGNIKPSQRGEKEIIDVLRFYLENCNLKTKLIERGATWLDAGSADSLLAASNFVKTLQERQGMIIACIEEIALRNRWIEKRQVQQSRRIYGNSIYGNNLEVFLRNFC